MFSFQLFCLISNKNLETSQTDVFVLPSFLKFCLSSLKSSFPRFHANCTSSHETNCSSSKWWKRSCKCGEKLISKQKLLPLLCSISLPSASFPCILSPRYFCPFSCNKISSLHRTGLQDFKSQEALSSSRNTRRVLICDLISGSLRLNHWKDIVWPGILVQLGATRSYPLLFPTIPTLLFLIARIRALASTPISLFISNASQNCYVQFFVVSLFFSR